jgi:hypothetical protein
LACGLAIEVVVVEGLAALGPPTLLSVRDQQADLGVFRMGISEFENQDGADLALAADNILEGLVFSMLC